MAWYNNVKKEETVWEIPQDLIELQNKLKIL